ncbi:two-component system response regulator [Candidatus Marinamargulisbacteria bacterium SCGC AG-439-L15]|nr:two-component system response regulator [Candidatus Marinamargulisbacteria bacterium SCGC AG-439-L15]
MGCYVFHKAKLLIVEDEMIIAEDIKSILEKNGEYEVSGIAKTGDEALELVEAHCPDLILMDICLSGDTDGIVTASYIRQTYKVPIVFITAYTDQALLKRVKKVEPFGYIVKPYTEESIHANIAIALHNAKSSRSRLREAVNFFHDFK